VELIYSPHRRLPEQMLEGSGRRPGEFKFDPLNFAKDEKSFKELQLKEVKNGRLAMLAFS
jgi:light-harvesting complex I chlorophyll a/b binding protein 3